jgi:citrate lyase subunit beta/citryl-CoA lyase
MPETANRSERSMLFVPAVRWPMIEKASGTPADAICIDLEDSVPPNEKTAARANVVRAFREIDFGYRLRMFRINGLDTPFAYRDLMEVVEGAGERIDLVVLPKAGSAADVMFVDRLLAQIEANIGIPHRIGIEAQIENASGFLYAREIAAASPRLEGLIFGPGDFAASMQMPAAHIGEFDENDRLYPGHRWHAVMHAIVAAARANGLRAIDGPYAAHKDPTGLQQAALIARAMGFDGKQCIHPVQLPVVNAVFTPSGEEAKRAEETIRAYDQAAASGRGAVTHDGRMIDAANLRMARVVLERYRLGQKSS